MCKIAQVASPKSNSKIISFIAIRWFTVQYCVITFSHAESDMSDFTAVLPVAWLETSETCTNCRASVTLKDIFEVTGFKENVYDILHVKCRYSDSGCTVTPTTKNLNEHERNCI